MVQWSDVACACVYDVADIRNQKKYLELDHSCCELGGLAEMTTWTSLALNMLGSSVALKATLGLSICWLCVAAFHGVRDRSSPPRERH